MRMRVVALTGMATAIAAGGMLVHVAPVQVEVHAQSAPTLKTAWGAPDISGTWSNAVVTPFERDEKFGERPRLTEEEHQQALEALRARSNNLGRDSREVDGKSALGTERDVARAYNEHWFGDDPTEVSYRTSMIIDPPDGRLPAYTADAQKRIAEKREYLQALLQGTSGGRPGPISPRRAEPSPDYNLDRMNRSDGPEDRGGPERCLQNGLPVVLGAGPLTPDGRPLGNFAGVIRIIQGPESVNIYYDIGQGSGFNRVIPITNRPHLPQNIRHYWGDSIARWEGDTLVVDVTNFSEKTNYRGSRENLHLIERYRRMDENNLEITITAEDPTTWVRPFTFVQELRKNADQPNMVYEGGCHEGNFGLLGMLANTRAAEELFRQGKGPDPATQDNATGGGN